MPTHDTQRFVAFADTLADAAREAIIPHFRATHSITNKLNDGRFDPVTDADQAAERAMLALIEHAFPDHGVLGEEYGERESKSGYQWILDPIDGTRAWANIRHGAKLVRYGYDCYAYCMVAAGHIDGVLESGLKPFDIAALIPIITGAGGGVCSWDGGDASQGGRVLAFGDARVRDEALRLLSPSR